MCCRPARQRSYGVLSTSSIASSRVNRQILMCPRARSPFTSQSMELAAALVVDVSTVPDDAQGLGDTLRSGEHPLTRSAPDAAQRVADGESPNPP